MDTYIVYVADGTVLGAAEAESLQDAAESVVNAMDWGDDAAAVDVNVARVIDSDYEVPDTFDGTDTAVEIEKIDLAVAVHD